MKGKEILYLLGFKPKPKTYGSVVERHEVGRFGTIEVACWQHPSAYPVVPSPAEIEELGRYLRPGDAAIDIGAHTGDTTLPVALAVGAEGLVLALEPNPYVFPVLERNAGLNRDRTRIVPLNFAAMRSEGTYEFHYGDEGFCNGGFHEGQSRWQHASAFEVSVEGRNLQDYVFEKHPDLPARLRYIKVDAEGFDLAILQTLEELIRAAKPYLRVEMFDLRRSSREDRRELYEFLVGCGYAVFRMEGEDRLAGERITDENLMQWDAYDVFCVPEGGEPTTRARTPATP